MRNAGESLKRTAKLLRGSRESIEYMLYNYPCKKRVCLILCALTCLCGWLGCAQHSYKKEADDQVYNIIDQKWDEDFGTKNNYKISDTVPSPNDIQIEKEITSFGVLTLPQAVALATAQNREYQTWKLIPTSVLTGCWREAPESALNLPQPGSTFLQAIYEAA